MRPGEEVRERIGPPAPRPCKSCPYRRDVPSGIWDESEYRKLVTYDGGTAGQPVEIFQCHQHDRGDSRSRICAGWAGCHAGGDDSAQLLSLRLAVVRGHISEATYVAASEYVSPVELFDSGAAAARHGMREVARPSRKAREMVAAIARHRPATADGES